MKKLLVLLALVAATAMPSPVRSAADETVYDVEVLVFENRRPELEGGETWKETAGETAGPNQAALPEGVPAPDSILSQAASALERDGRHRILIHRRWQQAAEAKPTSAPFRLQSTGGEIDGTMRFYLSRFLYVELDLVLRELGAVYPLAEHRRVRLQEIHYFDHPRLGALVRVATAKKPETPAEVAPVRPSR